MKDNQTLQNENSTGVVRCPKCKKIVDSIIIGPDPFAEELYSDTTSVAMCRECRKQSQLDI